MTGAKKQNTDFGSALRSGLCGASVGPRCGAADVVEAVILCVNIVQFVGSPETHRFVIVKELFFANASVVLAALRDHRVADAWNHESVLEDQTIGSLAGHLARGSVWVVADYLEAEAPDGPVDFESAAEYFAAVATTLTDDDHASIRQRGSAIAADGHGVVVARLNSRLAELEELLANQDRDRRVTVFAGKVMRLDDYLLTRLVEQVVHLDDLARSLGCEPWPNAAGAEALVVSCGAEIGRQRFGGAAMIRALFRTDVGVLPVL